MAHPSSPGSDASLASLVGGIINDAKDLLLHEFTMAKLEMKDELNKTKTAAVSLAIGAGISTVGGLLLILMLVHLLAALTSIPLWGSYGIIGAVLLLIGVILLMRGKQTAEQIDIVPPQTAATLKENAQWLKEQTTSNRT
jgi:hypothetical protein